MSKRFIEYSTKEIFELSAFKKDKWIIVSGREMCYGQTFNLNGCYVIYINGILSYIGQTNTIAYRFNQYQFQQDKNDYFITPWGIYEDMYCKVKYPKKYGKEAMIEKRLLRKLKPRFNKYKYKLRKDENWGKKEHE